LVAAIMTVQSFETPKNHGHLLDDVPALLVLAELLRLFSQTALSTRSWLSARK
jgi:hypothetical protein